MYLACLSSPVFPGLVLLEVWSTDVYSWQTGLLVGVDACANEAGAFRHIYNNLTLLGPLCHVYFLILHFYCSLEKLGCVITKPKQNKWFPFTEALEKLARTDTY